MFTGILKNQKCPNFYNIRKGRHQCTNRNAYSWASAHFTFRLDPHLFQCTMNIHVHHHRGICGSVGHFCLPPHVNRAPVPRKNGDL